MWTIYSDRHYPNGHGTISCVLLEDGCWTDQNNCNRYEQSSEGGRKCVMHKPKLFATRGGARNYKLTRLGDRKLYRIAKYTGPTDPDARPVRELWRMIPADAAQTGKSHER